VKAPRLKGSLSHEELCSLRKPSLTKLPNIDSTVASAKSKSAVPPNATRLLATPPLTKQIQEPIRHLRFQDKLDLLILSP